MLRLDRTVALTKLLHRRTARRGKVSSVLRSLDLQRQSQVETLTFYLPVPLGMGKTKAARMRQHAQLRWHGAAWEGPTTKPYSPDLRERMIQAAAIGMTRREAAIGMTRREMVECYRFSPSVLVLWRPCSAPKQCSKNGRWQYINGGGTREFCHAWLRSRIRDSTRSL